MTFVRRLWRGDLPLEAAFWHWAFLGGILVNAVTSFAFLALIAADRPFAALIAGYIPSIPFNVLALVGVWRSAGHHDGDPRWAAAARIVALAGMILFTVT